MATAKNALLVATETFSADVNGETVVCYAGLTRVRANDPIVRGREALFESADAKADLKSPSKPSKGKQ